MRLSALAWIRENKGDIQAQPGGEVYIARLVREDIVLHTAWWMDNGNMQILNQGDWRRRMAVGEDPFHSINVTADNANDLKCWIDELYGAHHYNSTLTQSLDAAIVPSYW